jgi:hypothetical protein
MLNLLTGKVHNSAHPLPDLDKLAEQPMTADGHLTAMRRLLVAASMRDNRPNAQTLLEAAAVHVEAAKAVCVTPLPVKTAPARTTPRDGDAI